MSMLESCTLTNPFGNEDECAKFIIDDITRPFILHDIMSADQEYTLSIWLKSETAGEVVVEEAVCSSSTSWLRYVHTFKATSSDLVFTFTVPGSYYIYHPQLEIGTVATDWTPAPEDVDQSISDSAASTREYVEEKSTEVLASAEGFTVNALANYVNLTEYGDFKESVETQFSVQAGQITAGFNTVTETINGEIETRQKLITLSDEGIVISMGENEMKLILDSNVIRFNKNNEDFGWWDGIDFHTGNINVETTKRAQFGNFAFVPRSDGSLSFLMVSNNTAFSANLVGDTLRLYNVSPVLDGTTMKIDATNVTVELSDTTLVMTAVETENETGGT